MKIYHPTGMDIDSVKRDMEANAVFGTGEPSDPIVAFVDSHNLIFYEQWSTTGRFRGWIEEEVNDKEYFERKLRGR